MEIKPGYGCSHPDAASLTHVVCTIDNFEATETGPYPSLVMNLGDQNDVVRFANLAGADIYNGFSLGAGNDTFMTNQTNTFDGSSVWGEWGNDSITTRAGSTVDAGEGNDTVHALGRKAFATGGKGHDTLYGGAGSQELVGWTGNDVIRGGAGADVIQGDKGNDTLYGGPGRRCAGQQRQRPAVRWPGQGQADRRSGSGRDPAELNTGRWLGVLAGSGEPGSAGLWGSDGGQLCSRAGPGPASLRACQTWTALQRGRAEPGAAGPHVRQTVSSSSSAASSRMSTGRTVRPTEA